jgi:hypothetical protein
MGGKRTLLIVAMAAVGLALTAVGASAKSGTAVSLSTALAFGDASACTHLPSSPCPASGTFSADDQTTANLICESGTISETHWFTHGLAGPITVADRVWTCPDGSTLVMKVLRWSFTPLTETTANIFETWVVTHGTGRLASLQGSGTMNEIFDFAADTLGGAVTGLVR